MYANIYRAIEKTGKTGKTGKLLYSLTLDLPQSIVLIII